MTARLRWTRARREGLALLARSGALRVSNETTESSIYWLTADWLCEHRLARVVRGNVVEITAAGASCGVLEVTL